MTIADSSMDMTDEVLAATMDCRPPNWDTSGFSKLLSRGWDINESLGNLGDALMQAVMANKTPLVAFHLDHGADPNLICITEEFTALEMAPKVDTDLGITSLLLEHRAVVKGRSAMLHAAQKGRVDIMRRLRDAGASVDEMPNNSDIFDDRRKQID